MSARLYQLARWHVFASNVFVAILSDSSDLTKRILISVDYLFILNVRITRWRRVRTLLECVRKKKKNNSIWLRMSERIRGTFNWSHGSQKKDYESSWWSCSTWVMMWFLSMKQKHEIHERENWEGFGFNWNDVRCTCAAQAKQNDSNVIFDANWENQAYDPCRNGRFLNKNISEFFFF